MSKVIDGLSYSRSDDFVVWNRSKEEMATGPITLDCACLGRDAGTINQIARLQLTARRNGTTVRLTNGDETLLDLVRFCGLAAVLGVQPGRQSE